MELENAENVEQLLGTTDAPAEPCAECAASRRMIAWGVVLGLGLGLSIGAILSGALSGK